MSRSWGESVRAVLCPDRAGLVRVGRGMRMLDGRVVRAAAAATGDPPWASALAALREGLDAVEGGGRDVTVVLSNHFVRYALVPWNDALAGEAEEAAHARHCFSMVYGDAAESWDVRLSAASGGLQVACAVDAGLPAAIEEVVAASGRHLRSVQPYLMAAFNRWRREFAGPLVWFVLAEPGRLCLAALQDGRWRELVNLQSADDARGDGLPELLARQRLLAGLDEAPGTVCVFAPDDAAGKALERAGESVHALRLAPLPDAVATEAGEIEMALNG